MDPVKCLEDVLSIEKLIVQLENDVKTYNW